MILCFYFLLFLHTPKSTKHSVCEQQKNYPDNGIVTSLQADMISLGRREFRTPFGLKEHPLSPKDEIMINFVSLVGKTDVVPTVLQNTEISRYKYEFFKNGKEPVCNED